jgi:hypothetical protein
MPIAEAVAYAVYLEDAGDPSGDNPIADVRPSGPGPNGVRLSWSGSGHLTTVSGASRLV